MIRFGASLVIATLAAGHAMAAPVQTAAQLWPIDAGLYRIRSSDSGLCVTAAADAGVVRMARSETVAAGLRACGAQARFQDQVFRVLPAAPVSAPAPVGARGDEPVATSGYTIRMMHERYGSPSQAAAFGSGVRPDAEPEIGLGAAGGDPAQGALMSSEACSDWSRSRAGAGGASQIFSISMASGGARLMLVHAQMCLTAEAGALTQDLCGRRGQSFVLEPLTAREARQASWRYRLVRPLTFSGLSPADAAAALRVRPLVGQVALTPGIGHWTREIRIGDTHDDGGVECLRRCQDDPTCAAFTWTKPGAGGVFARCFLQAPGYMTTGCDYCVSAVVRPDLAGPRR